MVLYWHVKKKKGGREATFLPPNLARKKKWALKKQAKILCSYLCSPEGENKAVCFQIQ